MLVANLEIVVFWVWLAVVEAAHVPAEYFALVLPDQVVHFEFVKSVAGTIEDAFIAVDAGLDPSLDNIPCVVAVVTIASACRAFDNFDFATAFELCHSYHSLPHLAGLLQSFFSALDSSHRYLRIEYLRYFGNSC